MVCAGDVVTLEGCAAHVHDTASKCISDIVKGDFLINEDCIEDVHCDAGKSPAGELHEQNRGNGSDVMSFSRSGRTTTTFADPPERLVRFLWRHVKVEGMLDVAHHVAVFVVKMKNDRIKSFLRDGTTMRAAGATEIGSIGPRKKRREVGASKLRVQNPHEELGCIFLASAIIFVPE